MRLPRPIALRNQVARDIVGSERLDAERIELAGEPSGRVEGSRGAEAVFIQLRRQASRRVVCSSTNAPSGLVIRRTRPLRS